MVNDEYTMNLSGLWRGAFLSVALNLGLLVTCEYSNYNLPENHMPFFFKNFPEELGKCLDDDLCPYKSLIPSSLPCWGYETDCPRSLAFSHAECSEHHKGWVRTKQEQENAFFEQGDFGYIKKHLEHIMVMCEPTFKDDSALECSKHLQFCRGRNLMMNFSTIVNRTEPFRYKMDVLSDGHFGGHCYLHKERLMKETDHMSPLQSWSPEMRFFTGMKDKVVDAKCDIVMEKPTFIMKIDAINMYHHLCDFFNLYGSLHMNASHPATFSTDVDIIIWETYPYYSAFSDMWDAFTHRPIRTLRELSGKTVCFKNVVFPLLPRMIFGLFYNTPLIHGCHNSGLFQAFSEFILHRLSIASAPRNDSRVHITLLSRETSFRNIINEGELLSALKDNSSYTVRRVVFNRQMPYREQLHVVKNTDIFIGMHGAGLTHLLFLPQWAAVFELYNCEDENCYWDLARLRGVKYATWQVSAKMKQQDQGHHPDGGAHAKFTNYSFDVKEFLKIVTRLAKHVQAHPAFVAATKHVHKIKRDEL